MIWIKGASTSEMQFPIATLSLKTLQFTAILGDLSHKTDIYLQRQDFSTTITCLFANCEQANYILNFAPFVIPPGNYNNHSIGTFFEFEYYTNLTFRLNYLQVLPSLHCVCA
jgi:hypothetical protein